MKDAIDRQPLAPLPAADGRDVTPQISGNLLPRLQAPPSRVGMGVWPRYRLGRHGSEGSCLTEAYHIVSFRGLNGRRAPFAPLCPILPQFARLCSLRRGVCRTEHVATSDQISGRLERRAG